MPMSQTKLPYSAEELALFIELVRQDEKLSEQLKSYSSAYVNQLEKDVEDSKSADDPLRKAASLYQALLESPLGSASGVSNARAALGSQLLSRAQNLGYLPQTAALESPAVTIDRVPSLNAPVKIYADGVFDLVHFGHFNAIRQARELGDELYVGVASDEEVRKAKGVYPIYCHAERARIIGACKWVSGVIPEAPYDVTLSFFATTGCHYVAHGDDLALNGDGIDSYDEIRRAGLLKTFKRTRGVSTTTIVSRLLGGQFFFMGVHRVPFPVASRLPTVLDYKSSEPTPAYHFAHLSFHESHTSGDEEDSNSSTVSQLPQLTLEAPQETCAFQSLNKRTLLSAKRIMQFMGQPKRAPPDSKIVYVDGSFDIFHCGHLSLLEAAKRLGDFLIVGIYDDATTRKLKGPLYPFQTMLERALNVMAMRVVDDVIIGAPHELTDYLLTTFKVSTVVRPNYGEDHDTCTPRENELKAKGILIEVPIDVAITSKTIIDRILTNRTKLETALVRRRMLYIDNRT